MEGPTPVSALIHAATMVTAGVYLVARMHPMFEQAPAAADVGAIVGCATLLIAATIGLVVTDLKRVIAYSTMSQIGYMVMAVSSAAYAAGLFHLMTHAFFKALLFMAAGSLISAMAGNQNLNDMGGFRKAMPFTFAMFIIGGLSLSGFPPFSGFFSKDEILADVAARDDWHVVLAVLGFVGSFLTAVYTFRMIFRAFWGEPVKEAQALLDGHLYHAEEHTNPATGEVEDTDVGFPGAEHHIAEQENGDGGRHGPARGRGDRRRAAADPARDRRHPPLPRAVVRRLALLRGARAVGRADDRRDAHRHGARDRRHRARLPPVGAREVRRAERAPHAAGAACTASSSNKWYFDEAINFLVVRPFAWFGRFARNTFERVVINGVFMGGTTAAVRAGSAAVRAAQSGYLRYYAALLLLGLTGLGLYFLVAGT